MLSQWVVPDVEDGPRSGVSDKEERTNGRRQGPSQGVGVP